MAIAANPDGTRVFVTGYSIGSQTNFDFATVAYDTATQAQLWVSRYNGPRNFTDQPVDLALSPDGTRVYVTGFSDGYYEGYSYTTIAYDAATGEQVWIAQHSTPGEASVMGISPDGSRVYVAGTSAPTEDYVTVAYDAATGTQLWHVRYDNGAADSPLALAISADGARVVVTGESQNNSPFDYATVAYDAETGAQQWVARYKKTNGNDFAYDVAVSPDSGAVYVTGESAASGGDTDYATLAYDAATGAPLWVARYSGPGFYADSAKVLRVAPDGTKVYVTGWVVTAHHGYDFVTLSYDAATGTQLWSARYNGPKNGDDLPYGLAVSPDGGLLYVTGSSAASYFLAPSGYATVAYDAGTGKTLAVSRWHDRFGGNDIPYAIAIRSQSVYVTGGGGAEGGLSDFVTLFYRG